MSLKRSIASVVITALFATALIPASVARAEEAPPPAQEVLVPIFGPEPSASLPDQYHTGEIIVRFKEQPFAESIESIGASLAAPEQSIAAGGLLQVVRPLVAQDVESTLAALRADPNVEFAELNYLFRAAATNDPRSAEQWALDEVAAGWGWSKGSTYLGSLNAATPVTVAIVDTGVDTGHEDLLGRVLPGRNVITGAPSASDVYDDARDGHGTHLAGLIAAATENGTGIAGLSGRYPVSILPVKALNADGFGSMLDIAAGIRWAADQGAQIINLSFGSRLPDYPVTLAEAVKYAQDRGALVVAAAGNEGRSVEGYYPASLPGVIAVAATGRDHRLSIFTNQSDVRAPGLDVLSTLPGNRYGALSGTSVSAGVVSGVAAVLRSVFPAKSQTQVIDAIKQGHVLYWDGNEQNTVLSMTLSMDQLIGTRPTPPNSITFIQPTEYRVHGTTQFVAQMREAVSVDYVQFRLEDAKRESQLLGTLQGALQSGTFELTWDSTAVPDGAYTVYAEAYDASNVLLATGNFHFQVYNAAASGLTVQVIKPDGSAAAGAAVTVYYAETASGPLQTLFQGNADLQGNLVIPGALATDGNEFLVVAQGSDPAFLYARSVVTPAYLTLDATNAYPVTISGRNGAGEPAVGANVWASLIAGPEFPAVSGEAPLVTLGSDGTATATVSQGLYTWRQFSADFAEYQVAREVAVDGATTVAIQPPDGGLATLTTVPGTGLFDLYGTTWSDADGFVLAGPKSSTMVVTPGRYSAAIHAEAPSTYFRHYYDFTVPTFEVAPGESRTIEFGNSLQMNLTADQSGQVALGSSVTFDAVVRDAAGNLLRVSQPTLYATYNGYPSSVSWPTWQISPYSPTGTYNLHAEWSAGPLGLVKSQPIAFEVVGGGGSSAPLTVKLIGKNGGPVFGQLFLLAKSPGGYTQVLPGSINNGVATFPASAFNPAGEYAVLFNGVSFVTGTNMGPVWWFEKVPKGPAPVTMTMDLNQVNLHKVQLQALDQLNQPLAGAQFFGYVQGADGSFGGGSIGAGPIWVPEGRYLFQAVKVGSNGAPTVDQYSLYSPVVDLPADLPTSGVISFGGTDQLTRLAVTLNEASSNLSFSAIGAFRTGLTGVGSPRFASKAPLYVTPGRYSVESLLQRYDQANNWVYWLARAVDAVGGESQAWQVGTDFTALVALERSIVEPNGTLTTTNLIQDGNDNRLVRMALNPQLGGVHLVPTGDPSLLAPFLVIRDEEGQEVHREKQVDALAEDGRYYAAWGGCFSSTCPFVASTTGPSSYFGQSVAVPGAWTGGTFTTHIELGVGPEGPVYAVPAPFLVSSAPVLDHLPAATQAGELILSGRAQAGQSVTIRYAIEGGAELEAGTVTADSTGRFSLTVELAVEGSYAFTAVNQEGVASAPLTIVRDLTAPGAPLALAWTSPDLNHIRLTWAAPAESDVIAYEIERDGAAIATVPATALLELLDGDLSPNTAYTFQVVAIDWAGNYSAPAVVTATTGAVADTESPSAPTGLQATLTEPAVAQLTWEAAADNVAVTGYNVYQSVDGGAPTLLATVADGLTFTATDLATSTTYTFTVTAIDQAGNESLPSQGAVVETAAMAVQEVQVRIRPLTRFGTALPGATVQVALIGDAKRQAEAVLRYQTWLDEAGALLGAPRELELVVPLTATAAAPTNYTGSAQLPAGAATVLGVTGRLSDGAGHTVSAEATAGLPQAIVGALSVQIAVPAQATAEEVAGALMGGAKLTLWSDSTASGGQLQPSVAGQYLVPELTPADDYQLRLVNPAGYELARITGITVYGGYLHSIVVEPRLPATMQLQVFDVDGQPKAARGTFRTPDGTDLSWSANADGKSNISYGRWAGESLTYTVITALPYVKNQSVTLTLKPGHNLATIHLTQYPKGQIEGTTIRNTDGAPMAGITVTLRQTVDGITWSETTKTDEAGRYSLSAFAGEATLEAVNVSGATRTLDPVAVTVPAGAVATQELRLHTRGTGTVLVDIYTRTPGGDWQGPILLDWRQASHYHLSATTKMGKYGGYPLRPVAMDGETVQVCVEGREMQLPNQCQEAIFDENLQAHVEFRLDAAQIAPIVLKVVDDATSEPVTFSSGAVFPMASFGSNWRRPAVQLLTNGSADVQLLENGTYEVVLVGPAGQVGTARFESVLGQSKVVEVRLKSGPYFTGQSGNGLFVSQTEFGLESFLTFRADFTNHGPDLKGAFFRLNAPGADSSFFQTINVTYDGLQAMAQQTASGNYEFWLGDIAAGQTSTVRYTVRVSSQNVANLLAVVSEASLSYFDGDAARTETIGLTAVPYNPVSIDVPALVREQEIVVAGNASPVGGLLTVYAGDTALGTTTVQGAGKWSLPITLPGTATKVRTHQLRVEVQDPATGETYDAMAKVKYDPHAVIMETISMTRPADDGSTVGITVNPGTVVPTFPFVLAPGKPVTVTVQFNEPDRVIDPVAEIPGMGKKTLQRGPDDLFRAEFTTWSGMPGALYTSYEAEPVPFEELEQPTLADMRESLPPALYNATVINQSVSNDDDAASGSAYASMVLNLDGDPSKQVSMAMAITPANLSPEEAEAQQKAAGGRPAWGLTIRHSVDGTSLIGYLKVGGSGGLNSFGPIAFSPAHVGTKAFEVTMKVLGPAQDTAQVLVAPDSLFSVDSRFRALLNQAQGCTYRADYYTKWLNDTYYWYVELQVMLGVVNIISIVAISSMVGTAAGALFSIAGFALAYAADQQLESDLSLLKERMDGDPACNPDGDDPDDDKKRKAIKPKWIMDPGGYVYEAVPENRLPGVTTTLLEKQSDGSWLFWDSEWYGQKNPLTTNAEGLYAWDVPEGDWMVVYEKDGYQTATSPSLHVPPPQTEVHQGMITLAAPTAQAITAGQDGAYLEVRFSQYMKASSLTDSTIRVTLEDGTPVEGSVTALDPVTANTGLLVTRTARFTPAEALAVGAAYLVDVSELVQNYAETTMAAGVVEKVVIPADLTAPGQVSGLTVSPADGALLLNWTNPADADFTYVRLAWSLTEYGPWVETRENGYAITGLANGVTYSVKLVTVDLAGNESAPIFVTGKPVDTTAPRAVMAAEVLPGAHQLALVWQDPADPDLAKVRVAWTGTDGESGIAELARGTQFLQLTELAPNVTYQFTLTPIDQVGNVGESVTVSGTTPVPPNVVVLEVTADQGPSKHESKDGSVALQIMPKTFTGPVALQVARLGWVQWPDATALTPFSGAYALTGAEFARPVTITLAYDPALLRNEESKQLAIYRQDAVDPTKWVRLGGSVNPGQGYVRADLDAPGVYAVMLAQ